MPASPLLRRVGGLPIDQDYLRRVIRELTAIGSSPLGFRTTGTPEDRAVAAYVSEQMLAIGLSNVAVEGVEVDAWRFRSASVKSPEASWLHEGVSFGGVPGTGPAGVTGQLVDVCDGRRRRLDRADLTGAVVLLEWRQPAVGPSAVVQELLLRGVIGVVVSCPEGGPWFQSPDALGAFDGQWPDGAPPMILVRQKAAAELRAQTGRPVTLTLDAEVQLGAVGSNVVGYHVGELPGPIIVGAHHDAWFRGAFDNTSGVAALLALAKALVDARVPTRHTMCFTSRTAEEYGAAGSAYDWCVGAWRQVQDTHPDWRTAAPFHLCLEASGHRALRTVVEAPVELAGWARRVCRAAEAEGWTPTGWRVAPPVAGTEQWPYLVAGIPGVAAYAWERSFGRTDYHTQHDTLELLDFDGLAAQVRLYALLLLDADQDPDAVLDHRARARQLAGLAARHEHEPLVAAAAQRRTVRGRAAFGAAAASLFALDTHGAACTPETQIARDLAALDAALAALEVGDRKAAARALTRVGSHALFPYLSEAALRAHTDRSLPSAVAGTWAAASHLTASPSVWPEIACLQGESGARPYGSWLPAALEQARERARTERDRRLSAIAVVLGPIDEGATRPRRIRRV